MEVGPRGDGPIIAQRCRGGRKRRRVYVVFPRREAQIIHQRNGGDRGQDGGELKPHKARPGAAGAGGQS